MSKPVRPTSKRCFARAATASRAGFVSRAVAAWAVACGALLVTAACSFDASVPGTARVKCARAADCPALDGAAYVCPPSLGVCVASGGATTSPAIVSADVTPPVAVAGATVTVTLLTSEPLFVPPRVTLFPLTGDPRALTLVSADARLTTFVLSAVVDVADGEGTLALRADLVGKDGLEALAQPAGEVRTDFTGPAVVDGSVLGRYEATGAPASGALALTSAPPLTALSATSSFVVSFAFDEALTAPAVVTAGALHAVAVEAGALSATWRVDLTGVPLDGSADGNVLVVAHAVDLAGNASDVVIASVPVDTTAPAAIGTGPGDAVLLRAPSNLLEPTSTLTVQTSALPAGAQLVVAGVADGSGGFVEIGRAARPLAGALVDVIMTGDRTAVVAAAVDAAGNVGPPATVHEIELTTSLAGKVVGSVVENPNRLVIASAPRDVLVDDLGVAFGAAELGGDVVGAVDGVTATASTLFAAEPISIGIPELRSIGVDRYVGRALGATFSRTFAFVTPGGTLTPTDPDGDGDPDVSLLLGSDFAFDARRGVTAFMARNSHFGIGRLWELRGTSFREAAPANGAVAYDSINGRVIVVTDAEEGASDVFAWGGAALTSIGSLSPGRFVPGLTDAPALGGVVVVGGDNTRDGVVDVVRIEADGSSTVLDDGSAAPFFVRPQVAYDDHAGAVLVSGSVSANETDVVAYDGTAWTVRTTSRNPIIAMASGNDAAVALVDHGDAIVVATLPADELLPVACSGARPGTISAAAKFGGDIVGVDLAQQTWRFTDGCWSIVAGAVAPSEVTMATVASDDLIVGFTAAGETWLFDGGTWFIAVPTDDAGINAPAPRFQPTMAADVVAGRVLLFSGGGSFGASITNDTWAFSGSDGTWTLLDDGSAVAPPVRQDAGAVLDRANARVVLYGGATPDEELWSWDGAAWSDVGPSGITTNGPAALAIAPDGNLVIASPDCDDFGRCFSERIYVPSDGQGATSLAVVDGGDGRPTALNFPFLTTAYGSLVAMALGFDDNLWRLTTERAPAVSAHIGLDALRVPADATIDGIDVDVTASAVSGCGDGVTLSTWTPYGYRARTTLGTESLGALSFSIDAPTAAAMRALDGVHLRLAPRACAGSASSITVDALSARVRYTVP